MKPTLSTATGVAIAAFLLGTVGLHAQQAEPPKEPAKVDKEFVEKLKQASKEMNVQQRMRNLQNQVVQNLQQVGAALVKFEAEYGGFPDEKTAARLTEKRGIKVELGAATANDCFLQLVAAQLIEDPKYFTFEKPDPPEAHEGHDHHHHHHDVDKCAFAFVSAPPSGANPLQPLAVAPLVKGKTTFDSGPLGGSAVILRADKSVVLVSIDKDGRVILEGMDLFDPGQTFWGGTAPAIKWPKD